MSIIKKNNISFHKFETSGGILSFRMNISLYFNETEVECSIPFTAHRADVLQYMFDNGTLFTLDLTESLDIDAGLGCDENDLRLKGKLSMDISTNLYREPLLKFIEELKEKGVHIEKFKNKDSVYLNVINF